MPRAWYSYNGFGDYDNLSAYTLCRSAITGLLFEPICNSSNRICAIYAVGDLVGGEQTIHPTDITYPRSFFGMAISNGVSQPVIGGANNQGRPYYVRVKT